MGAYRSHIKIFTIAFLCFFLIINGIVLSFNFFMRDRHEARNSIVVRAVEESDKENIEDIDVLLELAEASSRLNIVLLGLDGPRSDTNMFVSIDPDNGLIDIIAIPRDTYFPRKGFEGLAQSKFNAVYGAHGANGVKNAVSDLLFNIPIHHYITVTYSGAEAIINSLGGVPVFIPHLMKYEDPYDNPPLVIHFERGHHVLNGRDGVKFLRYRKATPGSGGMSYPDGDLGRIRAQQEFMKSALRRALSFRLPNVVATAFRFVRTDIQLQDAVRYATTLRGISIEEVNMVTMPGEAGDRRGVSFYFQDAKKTKDLLLRMYGYEDEKEEIIVNRYGIVIE